jgi:hypothetical protein
MGLRAAIRNVLRTAILEKVHVAPDKPAQDEGQQNQDNRNESISGHCQFPLDP